LPQERILMPLSCPCAGPDAVDLDAVTRISTAAARFALALARLGKKVRILRLVSERALAAVILKSLIIPCKEITRLYGQ
jgi:hypothetical protein